MTSSYPVDPELPPTNVLRPPLASATLAVAGGGAIGAGARALLTDAAGGVAPSSASATLLVNLTGAFGIGILIVVLTQRFPHSKFPRLFLGTGVLGGYTTFSGLAADTVDLAHAGTPALAMAYVAASVFGAVAAAVLGLRVGRRWLSLSAGRSNR